MQFWWRVKRLRYHVKFIQDTVQQILSESAEINGSYDKNILAYFLYTVFC